MDTKQYDPDMVEIDLWEILGLLLNRAWFIILCAVLCGTIGFSVSKFVITDMYQSTTSVYILNRQNENTVTYSDVQLGTQLTKDYAQLIKSRYVIEKVLENCHLDMTYGTLANRIEVSTPSDTRILKITVTDESPAMAQYIANEVRKEAAAHITSVMDIRAVNVVDEANLPKSPSSPNVAKWTIFGLAIGVFLSAAFTIVVFMLDDTIKTSDDVERYLGLSTLGMIPIRKDPDKARRSSRKKSKSGNRSSTSKQTTSSTMMSIRDENVKMEATDANGDF